MSYLSQMEIMCLPFQEVGSAFSLASGHSFVPGLLFTPVLRVLGFLVLEDERRRHFIQSSCFVLDRPSTR